MAARCRHRLWRDETGRGRRDRRSRGRVGDGPSAGEVAAFLALAIRARVLVSLLMEVIYQYPTFARGIRGALRRLS